MEVESKQDYGFIPDTVRILKKYSLWEYLDNYLQTGNFPSKSEWKRVVVESLKKVENEKWEKKIHFYNQLRYPMGFIIICSRHYGRSIRLYA